MDRDAIRAKVMEILRDVVDDPRLEITDSTTAHDVKRWHSANHVRLIVALEADFDIRFETDEITQPESIGELVDLIRSKLG